MYTIKEMKFPIFITLDENGVHSTGEQMYKLEVQDADLQIDRIECSDVDFLIHMLDLKLRELIAVKEYPQPSAQPKCKSTLANHIEDNDLESLTIKPTRIRPKSWDEGGQVEVFKPGQFDKPDEFGEEFNWELQELLIIDEDINKL